MQDESVKKGEEGFLPEKEKKPKTFLTKSIIIFLSFVATEGFLFVTLHFSAQLALRFEWVIDKLEWVENIILQYMNAKNIIFVCLVFFFIYFIKAYFPFLPLSIVCLMCSIMFGKYWWAAFILNMLGLSLMFYLRFNSGRVKGSTYMQNLLRKNKYVRLALDANNVMSYSLLAAFRFFPCFPINFVSRLYGANAECKFQWYMVVSILAIAPRTYVYTRIGREVFNPFSESFIVLLMILAAFSGVGIFITNIVIYIRRKREQKRTSAEIERLKYEEQSYYAAEREPYTPIDEDDLRGYTNENFYNSNN